LTLFRHKRKLEAARMSASDATTAAMHQGAQWLQGMKEAAMSMTSQEKKDEDEVSACRPLLLGVRAPAG
tara:strand:+ start:490 stop:696 length:207 start_codon:yes stop_codon:yes gene_type:complete